MGDVGLGVLEQIRKHAKSGFEVWQMTVDMVDENELDAGQLSKEIERLRNVKSWFHKDDVEAVLELFLNKLQELLEKRPIVQMHHKDKVDKWFEEFEGVLKMENKK